MFRHCRRAGQEVSVSRALPNCRISQVRVSLTKLSKNKYSELRKQGQENPWIKSFGNAPFKTSVAASLHLPVSDGQSDPGTEAFDPRIFLTLYSYTD